MAKKKRQRRGIPSIAQQEKQLSKFRKNPKEFDKFMGDFGQDKAAPSMFNTKHRKERDTQQTKKRPASRSGGSDMPEIEIREVDPPAESDSGQSSEHMLREIRDFARDIRDIVQQALSV